MDQRHPVVESTLRELREIVAAAQNMPAGSVVRVRTRFGTSANGVLLKRVLIIEPEPTPPSEVVDERDWFREPPSGPRDD